MKAKKSFLFQNSTCIDVEEISDHVLYSFEQRCGSHKSRKYPPSPKARATGLQGVDWKEARPRYLGYLCCVRLHLLFVLRILYAKHLKEFVCYQLLAPCFTWRKAWAHCHHIHGFLTRYHFTDRIISSIPPSSIPRGSRRALVRIGKTRHIEPRSHVMVEPEDIWPLLCSPIS